MKIGVLSDTHVPRRARKIPDTVINGLQGVDLILHAGDLVSTSVLDTLRQIAPVEAVAGNMDPPELLWLLGRSRVLELAGYKLGLIHGDGVSGTIVERAYSAFKGVRCIIFGHSHIPYNDYYKGVLMFNPGSPTDKRHNPQYSYGLLYLEQDGIHGEIVNFD